MNDMTKTWEIEDRIFTAEDVATEILKHVYKSIREQEALTENDIIEAVITTPAYFTALANSRTENAAKRAGFVVKQIITEPVAAAIACKQDLDQSKMIYIFDLGGGTFDVSIVEIDMSSDRFDVKVVEGDQKLGGDDFDLVIIELMKKQILEDIGILLSHESIKEVHPDNQYSQVMQKLTIEAEKVKILLSSEDNVDVFIGNLFKDKSGQAYDLSLNITRTQFENKCQRLFRRIKEIVERSLTDVDLKNSIDQVILVGGSSKIPYVSKMIKEIFQKEPYADRDLSKVVAMGAAFYAAKPGIVVENLTAHSLGIEVINNQFVPILAKNSKCPIKGTKNFTTTVDNQKAIKISVYEGECIENVKDNYFYTSFNLDNIQIAPKGIPSIEVTFIINENRMLEVKARDTNTNSQISVEIKLK